MADVSGPTRRSFRFVLKGKLVRSKRVGLSGLSGQVVTLYYFGQR